MKKHCLLLALFSAFRCAALASAVTSDDPTFAMQWKLIDLVAGVPPKESAIRTLCKSKLEPVWGPEVGPGVEQHIAVDSGLACEILDGAPAVYYARKCYITSPKTKKTYPYFFPGEPSLKDRKIGQGIAGTRCRKKYGAKAKTKGFEYSCAKPGLLQLTYKCELD